MAHKGDRYQQVPTLWHIGAGLPCRVMRKRKGQKRWQNHCYGVLTYASAMRWARLRSRGVAEIRRDVNMETMLQFGIGRVSVQRWATRKEASCT